MIKTQDLKLQMDELTKQNDMVLIELEQVKKMLINSAQSTQGSQGQQQPLIMVIATQTSQQAITSRVKTKAKIKSQDQGQNQSQSKKAAKVTRMSASNGLSQ